MLSAIAHQMRRSQVLPGYPHSSAGAYGLDVCLLINNGQLAIRSMHIQDSKNQGRQARKAEEALTYTKCAKKNLIVHVVWSSYLTVLVRRIYMCQRVCLH